MQTVIALFNLKSGVSREAYEHWARSSDLPVVNGLASIDTFEVLKATGLLMGGGVAPYEYIEILRVADMQAFARDMEREDTRAGVTQFQQYADRPVFILAGNL